MCNDITFERKPYAILHERLCDNFSECPAKIACKNKSQDEKRQPAIYMNENNKISVNRTYCIGCGTCVEHCALFRIVSSPYMEREIREEFERDPRTGMDFTVERFGCDAINSEEYLLKTMSDVDRYIAESCGTKINILEFVDASHVMCPFQAVDVEFITRQMEQLGEYRKFVADDRTPGIFTEINHRFLIREFPAILLLSGGEVVDNPITKEFRVRREEDRIDLQLELQQEFLCRLERINGDGTPSEHKSV